MMIGHSGDHYCLYDEQEPFEWPQCQHDWKYDHSYDDWYDGDSDDYYKCTNCGELQMRYVPR